MAKSDSYWIYGVHAATQALQNTERKVRRVLVTPNAFPRMEKALKEAGIRAEVVEAKRMEHMLPKGAVHQGVALETDALKEVFLEDILAAKNKRPIVVLDQVTDPHNVGAILRSAAAFDAAAVVTTERNSPEASATMAKAASGALDVVPFITVTNLAHALRQMKDAGYWIAGMDGEAKQTIAQAKLGKDTALVMGAEGKGMRRLTAELCDFTVKLPMSGAMESLNVSNAAAIALYVLYSA